MNASSPARGLIALLRLPYWMMTGGLAVLTAFAILKGNFADIPTMLGPPKRCLCDVVDFLFYVFHRFWRICHKRLL